jgi:hypothetical protein
LDFLGLIPTGEPEPFSPGKVYSDYYSEGERRAVAEFAREFSSKTTWAALNTYFEL